MNSAVSSVTAYGGIYNLGGALRQIAYNGCLSTQYGEALPATASKARLNDALGQASQLNAQYLIPNTQFLIPNF